MPIRIKNVDIFWRKAILYSAITALGLAMVALIGIRFKSQLQNTRQAGFLDQAALLKLRNKTNQQWQKFQVEKQRLEEQFQALQGLSTTTTTTTVATTSTSTSAVPMPQGLR